MDLLTLSMAKKYTDESILGTDGINKGDKGDKGDPGYTPVRGVDYWTEDDKNSIISEIDPAPPIVCKETGSVIAVNDASDRLLKGLTLYGKTTQDGTPTPDNPVELVSAGASGAINTTVAGKNMLDYKANTVSPNLSAEVGNDGSTHLFTNTEGAWNAIYFPQFTFKKGVSYTASFELLKLVSGAVLFGFRSVADNIFIPGVTAPTKAGRYSATFTPTEDTLAYISICITSDTVLSGDITYCNLQLEVGSVATDYEPYKEIQTLTASTPNGLPGIPVSADGNYTDENGQQWICDEIDFGRGVYVQRVGTATYMGSTSENWGKSGATEGDRFYTQHSRFSTMKPVLCNLAKCSGSVKYVPGSCWISKHATLEAYYFEIVAAEHGTFADVTAWKAFLNSTPLTIQYVLAESIETPLSAEELAAYAALHSNKPTTTVYNDAGVGLAVEYVADTKNYIDQKLAAISAALLNA